MQITRKTHHRCKGPSGYIENTRRVRGHRSPGKPYRFAGRVIRNTEHGWESTVPVGFSPETNGLTGGGFINIISKRNQGFLTPPTLQVPGPRDSEMYVCMYACMCYWG